MAKDRTTVEISRDTWKRLNSRKEPGDSFDDVIRRLLHSGAHEEPEEHEEVSDGGFSYTCSCNSTLTTVEEIHDHLTDGHELGSD